MDNGLKIENEEQEDIKIENKNINEKFEISSNNINEINNIKDNEEKE